MIKTEHIQNTAVIALCFLLTSIGWLSWEYHLMEQVPAAVSDVWTMVAGYLLQAAGTALSAFIIHRRKVMAEQMMFFVLLLHMACMVPAVISHYMAGTLVFGLLMNLLCGMIAGYYLYRLTCTCSAEKRASVFGTAYGAAILAQWILSLAAGGAVYYSKWILLVCAGLTLLIIIIFYKMPAEDVKTRQISDPGRSQKKTVSRKTLYLSFLLVLLFSIVNSCSFSFSSGDIGQAVNVEFLRLVYAAGLFIAGFITDRNRKYGAVCALTALVLPFIILSLRGEITSSVVFWILSYFFFGFFAVYRITVFSDLAENTGLLAISAAGLAAGRMGDAIGEMLCILLMNRPVQFILLASLLFAASAALFFRLYPFLYISGPTTQRSEKDKFYHFSMAYDLSARERDVLRILLEEKTNAEAADHLSISENTIKFHVRNLLKKTGCKNRKALLAAYIDWFEE